MKRIAFDDMPWETSPSAVRFKVQKVGVNQLRLLEFSRDSRASALVQNVDTGDVGDRRSHSPRLTCHRTGIVDE